ncbi:DUF7512 family protein [Halalkalicoccus jeotgali]|uniref:Uncharacterized protein n=1 Tax=Halalkalicoccus jeotgali (strain DSM 18796 / CECT 7217 / JCM 14584 / KCTC 4019 / B3) TaxID=795797 RepID=D8J789_HALJB|nr:hypothetical protein [Halalkalicoccus jeotgali]ADJ13984.1 hypothetical protein HacjB3_02955 [Halalkalicoccus jeotgali B3]ELY33971.1 hypothetical protein C497_16357 [Halalkalicoccus jeotgali B3]
MIGLETLGGSAQAVGTIGVVLAEAITLYVGYGTVTRIASPVVLKLLGGE